MKRRFSGATGADGQDGTDLRVRDERAYAETHPRASWPKEHRVKRGICDRQADLAALRRAQRVLLGHGELVAQRRRRALDLNVIAAQNLHLAVRRCVIGARVAGCDEPAIGVPLLLVQRGGARCREGAASPDSTLSGGPP